MNFPECLEILKSVQKLSEFLKISQTFQKLSRGSGDFQSVQKLSKMSRSFAERLETFQRVQNQYIVSRNF